MKALGLCMALSCTFFSKALSFHHVTITRIEPVRTINLPHSVGVSPRKHPNSLKSKVPLFSAGTQVDIESVTSSLYDVVICGAGPGGLLLASEICRIQQQQRQNENGSQYGSLTPPLRMAVIDPALDQPWPNNYGIWMDEADYLGHPDCVEKVWKEVDVIFDETTPVVTLTRPYGRVDRTRFKAKLLNTINNGYKQDNPNVQMMPGFKATRVQHYPDQPSTVSVLNVKTGQQQDLQALLVVDATGFSRQFVKHDTKFDPGFQVTYGARFRVKNLGPYSVDRMVLMDYSEGHLHHNPSMVHSNDRFPSFLYALPLAEDELFLEETVLVSRPAASSKDLQARLYERMKVLGVEHLEILEDERAAIPMGGMDPIVPQRTLGFGATASLVHPASGYMVARAMEIAPRVAKLVVPKLQSLRRQLNLQQQQNAAVRIPLDALDEVAEAGWSAVWPVDDRRQRDFMHFGFELLCLLNPQELRDFFTGFFRLPDALWEHFLSWRLSGIGHVVMGLRVWAQCIPKRFMPAMLWKALPFVPTRLVGPSLSRGNFAPINTTSVYADARTGDYHLWEPENFYPYVKKLSDQEYMDRTVTSDTIRSDPATVSKVAIE